MKILFLSAFPPSNYGAGVNYTFNLINNLRRAHQVDVFYFRHKSSEGMIENARAYTNNPFTKGIRALMLFFIHPFFSARFSIIVYFKLLRIKDNYDIIYFDFSQVLVYSLFLRHKRKYFMSHDVIYQKYARKSGILAYINKVFIFFTEKHLMKYAGCDILVFSNKDKAILRRIYQQRSSVVDFFIHDMIRSADPFLRENYFCFFGAWNRNENIEALEWFLKNIIESVNPDIKFKVIGGGMTVSLINNCNRFPNVEVMGFVDDPYQIIASGSGLLAPLFQGAGVKLKVLESLLCGVPVIGTKIALEGIEKKLLKNAHLFRTMNELIDLIEQSTILNDYNRKEWKDRINMYYPKRSFSELLS